MRDRHIVFIVRFACRLKVRRKGRANIEWRIDFSVADRGGFEYGRQGAHDSKASYGSHGYSMRKTCALMLAIAGFNGCTTASLNDPRSLAAQQAADPGCSAPVLA